MSEVNVHDQRPPLLWPKNILYIHNFSNGILYESPGHEFNWIKCCPVLYRIYNYQSDNAYANTSDMYLNDQDDVDVIGRTVIYSRKAGKHTKPARTFKKSMSKIRFKKSMSKIRFKKSMSKILFKKSMSKIYF
jgi:hypothetical protein